MSTHLLSLPAETLDSITAYLPHPIDALNLSKTCRYFNQHLSMQHNNKFWYTMLTGSRWRYGLRPLPDCETGWVPGGSSQLVYDPVRDYKSYVLRALARNGCQFCLTSMQHPLNKTNRDWCECQAPTAISKFRGLGLDITTNPPKSSSVKIFYLKLRREISMTYYWKFDIESLCIAQFGIGLGNLQRRREEEKRAVEARKKTNPSPTRKLRDQAKSNLAESVWAVWNEEVYRHPRERWGKDLTKEQLLAWLFLRQEDTEPQGANVTGTLFRYLKPIRGKATFAAKDQEWYDLVARELLELLKDRNYAEDGYRRLSFSWHLKRITDIYEQLPFDDRPDSYQCWYEHPNGELVYQYELPDLLSHMEEEHPVFYWSSDEWGGLLPAA
ncbi:unnamed protein product [Tuber aestivum]|uniref:F-box domain-containing protein n=1 Tax=Tuber aestivum TaxID=59557 RepID=A0A292PYH2_9PEZI|nr:unnamed protein product [Tuber aestivum]